ncbi:MAG: hypothetical protein IPP88_23485 [Betaproteobacteria bacterium]|nr:hypothetical protein [Betaproteobacteria bacterium]
MKTLFMLVCVCAFGLPAGLYAFRDNSWECKTKVTVGFVQRDGNKLSVRDSQIEESGAIISDSSLSLSSPLRFEFNLRGKGNFHFRYSENVSKVGLWSGRIKVYDGPPIDSFIFGKGRLGVGLRRREVHLLKCQINAQFEVLSVALAEHRVVSTSTGAVSRPKRLKHRTNTRVLPFNATSHQTNP